MESRVTSRENEVRSEKLEVRRTGTVDRRGYGRRGNGCLMDLDWV
ncbi:MAG TPA: hypothetical protein VK921_19535 [Anditalea sp.]|nr:hypothetical protein [Anditalea sp.]